MNTPRTDRILDNLAVAMTADTREQSKAHSEEACREIEQLETELAAVTAERDALKEELQHYIDEGLIIKESEDGL